MQIKDSLTLDASGLSRTKDGYLIGDARVSRAGNVQQYYGREIGLTGDDAGKSFGVYRDPSVVFDEASMMSLAGRPVTRGHPPEGVDAKTWRDLSVGHVGGRIVRDGEHVVAQMAIMDATAADEVEGGARALSAGYTVGIIADEGAAPDGTPYQYRQTGSLRFNHVAYLPGNNPRAGNTRIGDAHNWGLEPSLTTADKKGTAMTDQQRTIMVDGLSIPVTDQGAQVIEKLQKTIETKDAELATKDADHAKEIAAKDAAIAKAEAERDAEKAKVISDADLDKKVQARADLVSKAKAIVSDVKTEGLSDADIRKAVVKAKLGDEAVEGKSEAYLDARFDILAEGVETKDAAAEHLKEGQKVVTDMNAVHTKFAQGLSDAWKNPTGTKED